MRGYQAQRQKRCCPGWRSKLQPWKHKNWERAANSSLNNLTHSAMLFENSRGFRCARQPLGGHLATPQRWVALCWACIDWRFAKASYKQPRGQLVLKGYGQGWFWDPARTNLVYLTFPWSTKVSIRIPWPGGGGAPGQRGDGGWWWGPNL